MLGRFDEAWPLAYEAYARYRELTGRDTGYVLAEIATLIGDHSSAADYLRVFCDWCEAHGARAELSTCVPALGRSLCMLRGYDEAELLAERGRELGDVQDVSAQMLWRQVKALVLASRDEQAQAEKLAREAVVINELTDALNHQGEAFCDLAEVLKATGRTHEAADALEQALARYKRKENLVMTERVRARLTELRASFAPAKRA
jgi:tetratricopeptide (TPR) repeat protein